MYVQYIAKCINDIMCEELEQGKEFIPNHT